MSSNNTLSIDCLKAILAGMDITVRLDMLTNKLEITGMPPRYSAGNATNTLLVLLEDTLKALSYKDANSTRISGILAAIADEKRFNPIKEWLEPGYWDGVSRVPVLYEILGVTQLKYMTYIRKWLIQCIALILNDENNPIGAEGILVLQGPQGIAKTSFFRKLVPFPKYFVEGASIDVQNKDSLLNALDAWICELGELDSTLKREQAALKAFVTAVRDRIRRPYARSATDTARRTSFCGTVNSKDYLRDETGSRRFWTVPISHIDKPRLFALDDDFVFQLWLEIYELYRQNPTGFRLTDAEMKGLQEDNDSFTYPLAHEIEVRELLDFQLDSGGIWKWWKASEVAEKFKPTASAVQVGKVLTKIVKEEHESGRWTGCSGNVPETRERQKTNQYLLPIIHK